MTLLGGDIDLATAMEDRNLLGRFFAGESYRVVRVLGKCVSGRPLSDYTAEELQIVLECTGATPPTVPPRELFVIAGRRASKTTFASAAVVHRAALVDYRGLGVLRPGQRARAMLIGADKRQAGEAHGIIDEMMSTPLLAPLVERRTQEGIHLSNGISIEVHSASFRRVRGYTLACAVLDELCFWSTDTDAADPDIEIVNAIRPALATVPTGLLMGISSPHGRKGFMWQQYTRSPLARAAA